MLELGLDFVLLVVEVGQEALRLRDQLIFLLQFLPLSVGIALELGSLGLELELELADLNFELSVLRVDTLVFGLEGVDLGEGAGHLIGLRLQLALQRVQVILVLCDQVRLFGDLVCQRFDPRAQVLDLLVLRTQELIVRLQLGLELHDKLSALLESGLVSSALGVLALGLRLHLGNLGLSLVQLASFLAELDLLLSDSFFKLVELALKLLALIFASVQLGQRLIELVLKLAFKRLLLVLSLIDKVRELSLGSVPVMSEVFLDGLLFRLVGLMLTRQCLDSLLKRRSRAL